MNVNKRRVPPKARHRERPQQRRADVQPQRDDPNSYNAPSHMGGQFDDHGYGSGHGLFGFTHSTID